jgi:hypothetical protein
VFFGSTTLQFHCSSANSLWQKLIANLAPSATKDINRGLFSQVSLNIDFSCPKTLAQSKGDLNSCKPTDLKHKCPKSNGVLVMTSWSRGSNYASLRTSSRQDPIKNGRLTKKGNDHNHGTTLSQLHGDGLWPQSGEIIE